MQACGLQATGASSCQKIFVSSERRCPYVRAPKRFDTAVVLTATNKAATTEVVSDWRARARAGVAGVFLGLLPLVSGHAAYAADSALISFGGVGGGGGSLQDRVTELRQFQSMFGSRQSPTQQLAADVQAVQGVVQRAELLLRAGDAGGARALLSQQGREVGKLSYGLGFGTEAYRLLPAQAGRQVLSKLEASRAALAAVAAEQAQGTAGEPQFPGGLPTGGRADTGIIAGTVPNRDGSVAREHEAVEVALARLRELGALLQTVADYLEAAGD